MPPTAAGRHLALGDRVEDAASVFGPLYDDVELSSYAAYEQDGAGLDDALLDSVGMVAGDGLEPALRRTLDRRAGGGEDAPTLLLGLPADLDGVEQVRRLADDLGLALRPEHSSPDGLVLRVCPGEEPQPWEVPAPEAPAPARVAAEPTDDLPASDVADAPTGSRLRQLVVVGALGLLVVLAVAVVLLITVGTGAAVVLLLVAVLAAVGVSTALTLALLRRLAALETRLEADLLGDQAAFRRQLRNRTERVEQRQRRLGQADRDRHEATLAELRATQERVTALSVLTARLAAQEDGEPRDR